MDQKLSLSWEAYQKSICDGLSLLQQRGEFVDMTLAADGHRVKVHQMVLSLVSPFIKDLITSANCPHPVIFLNKVSYDTLQSILEYAYTGEVVVAREELANFLETCKELHIKGLEGDNIQVKGDDGDLLHLIGARGGEDPEYPETPQGKQPVRIAFSRRKVAPVEDFEVLEETTHDDDYQMDEHALDDVEESIVHEQEIEESEIKPKASIQSERYVEPEQQLQGRKVHCLMKLQKDSKGKTKRRRCVHCWNTKKERIMSLAACETCPQQPGLCIECFRAYHKY